MMGKKVMKRCPISTSRCTNTPSPHKKKIWDGKGRKGGGCYARADAQDTRANLMSRTPSVAMIWHVPDDINLLRRMSSVSHKFIIRCPVEYRSGRHRDNLRRDTEWEIVIREYHTIMFKCGFLRSPQEKLLSLTPLKFAFCLFKDIMCYRSRIFIG